MEMRAEHRAHFNSSPKTAAFRVTPLLGGFKIAAKILSILSAVVFSVICASVGVVYAV